MKTLRYAIIEDERPAQERLVRIIRKMYPEWVNVACCETVEEAVDFFSTPSAADLVFMDIELTDGNSFQIFSRVPITIPVIFTTAYNEYALNAFKVSSIDYLLKPVTEEDVKKAVEKYQSFCNQPQPLPDLSKIAEMFKAPQRKRILTTSGDNFDYVELADISWFMVEDDYVFAILKSGIRRMTTHTNLTKLTDDLPQSDFFKLSRNIIASIDSISKVCKHFRGRLKVRLKASDCEEECMVSAAQRDTFLEWLGK